MARALPRGFFGKVEGMSATQDVQAVPESWAPALGPVLATPEARRLGGWLKAEEAAGKVIYPPRGTRLRALELTPLDQVRVVILGQDPYHGEGQAHGLAFSVQPGVRPPPSLVNIYKEMATDLGIAPPGHGLLDHWARQGVLLLNSVLTVRMGQAASHQGRGWERFTDAVIRAVAAKPEPVVFILWGAYAQKKAGFVRELGAGRHCVLTSVHPSPLSALRPPVPFIGCGHFSQARAWRDQPHR